MRRARTLSTAVCLLLAAGTSACSPAIAGTSAKATAAPGAPSPVVYAAVGASETFGIGADDRYRQAWPQLFYQDALPPTAVMYNFGTPGITTAQALTDELPAAEAVHPTVVTVWLNVNDLIQGVTPADYEARLRRLVEGFRQRGAQVLVANTPNLQQLPAYRACLPNPPAGGPACLLPAGLAPPPDQVKAAIDAYNAAIARVTRDQKATLVDLAAPSIDLAKHPDWLSADGFHPNGHGYAAIAAAFEAAYRQRSA